MAAVEEVSVVDVAAAAMAADVVVEAMVVVEATAEDMAVVEEDMVVVEADGKSSLKQSS